VGNKSGFVNLRLKKCLLGVKVRKKGFFLSVCIYPVVGKDPNYKEV
jgi:hypothetical protein